MNNFEQEIEEVKKVAKKQGNIINDVYCSFHFSLLKTKFYIISQNENYFSTFPQKSQ